METLNNILGQLERALELHAKGLRLVPLVGKGAVLPGWPSSHLSEADIRTWARDGVNWGIITGAPLIVLDTDNDLAESWIKEKGIESGVMVRSGGGGTHRYFVAPDGAEIRSKNGMHKIHGLDVKADGGYIVAVGSIHPDTGQRYEHLPGKELRDLGELPVFDRAWLPQEPVWTPEPRLITPVDHVGGNVRDIRAYLRRVPSKEHAGGNKGLMRTCFVLVDEGFDFNSALQEALIWNADVADPPWKPSEVERALRSAFRINAGQFLKGG